MGHNQKKPVRVGTYWVNDFSGGSGDDQLKYSDDLAEGFAKAMVAHGHHWPVKRDSSSASPTEWLSYPSDTGIDYDNLDALQGADSSNFVYLVTHGGLTYRDMPAPKDDMYVFRAAFGVSALFVPETAFMVRARDKQKYGRYIWLNHKSKLGDWRLQWLVVDACESVQLAGFVKGPNQNLDVNPAKMWFRAFHGLNMVFGFTGESSDTWWIGDRGSDFGRRAGRGERLGDAWIDEGYSYWTKDIPVVMACGRTKEDVYERLRTDSVNSPKPRIPHKEVQWFAWWWRS